MESLYGEQKGSLDDRNVLHTKKTVYWKFYNCPLLETLFVKSMPCLFRGRIDSSHVTDEINVHATNQIKYNKQ